MQKKTVKNKLHNLFSFFRRTFGLVVLCGVYFFSIFWVYYIKPMTLETEPGTEKRVLRIAHRLSDKKFAQAMEYVAREYEKRNPDVSIIVQSIPKKAYKQWVTTQCIGATVPDIVQGPEDIWDQMWHSIATRYMMPLTEYVNLPNPYNKATALEGVPWRSTYLDEMESGYWVHLTEFFSIPLTVETTRIFYNKDLFRKIFQDDTPPQYFEEWMTQCRKIQEYAQKEHLALFPIASSKENVISRFTFLNRYYY